MHDIVVGSNGATDDTVIHLDEPPSLRMDGCDHPIQDLQAGDMSFGRQKEKPHPLVRGGVRGQNKLQDSLFVR